MRTFWARFAAVVAIVAGVGLGASAVPASAASVHPSTRSAVVHSSHAAPSDIWW